MTEPLPRGNGQDERSESAHCRVKEDTRKERQFLQQEIIMFLCMVSCPREACVCSYVVLRNLSQNEECCQRDRSAPVWESESSQSASKRKSERLEPVESVRNQRGYSWRANPQRARERSEQQPSRQRVGAHHGSPAGTISWHPQPSSLASRSSEAVAGILRLGVPCQVPPDKPGRVRRGKGGKSRRFTSGTWGYSVIRETQPGVCRVHENE